MALLAVFDMDLKIESPNPMHPYLLLFDIDATLLRTGGAGMHAMANTAQAIFGKPFTWEGIHAGGALDPVIFAEAAALNGIENNHDNHARFRDHYISELDRQIADNLHQFEILPGVHELLQVLRERERTQRDIVLGLLTGNYTHAVPVKLKYARLEPSWFSITAFGDEASSRPDLVALAMQKFEAKHHIKPDPTRVIIIGDTPRDVACAKAHGCICIAVATGTYPADHLRDCGADHVLPDLSDASTLFQLLR